jgi:hypothetical protein
VSSVAATLTGWNVSERPKYVETGEYYRALLRIFVGLIGHSAAVAKSRCFSYELLQEHKCLDLTRGN